MIKKLVVLGAAIAMPLALFVPASHASVAKVDVSDDTITCNTVIATIGLKPSLSNAGTASTPLLSTVKGTVGGCVVSGPNAATILSGTFTGKLSSTGNTCTGLLGTAPSSGTLTFKWKADKTTPLLQTSSVVTVTSVTGGVHAESLNGGSQSYGDFQVGSSGVTGAFTGSDHGATSSNESVTSEDVGNIFAQCGAAGVKTIHIGIGTFTLA